MTCVLTYSLTEAALVGGGLHMALSALYGRYSGALTALWLFNV